MTEPTVSAAISGGTQSGIIGAATVTAAQIIINNYLPSVAEPTTVVEAIGSCPYPGLAYFGPDDANRFFGRDEAIGKLVTAVSRQSLTAVVGASGSGKSSVVLAGLAPRLHLTGGWLFSYFRIGNEPYGDPFLALARALVPFYVASSDETERLVNTRKLAEKLRSGELKLRDVFAACRGQNKGSRILLIADQFEEAFTLVLDDANRNQFIDVLLAGFLDPASGGTPDICLVLTLRADFYGRALLHRPLADALQGRVENLGPMSREELRLAIEKPAEKATVSFEPGLIETLLDDVENKPGSLPLLQFALREMWGRQEHRKITRKSYDDIGGVEGALAQRAETIFAVMTENGANSQIAHAFQRLFTRLVAPGEGQEDTRRVADRRELGDDVWSLAQRLADEDNRLVVTNAPAFSHSRETAEVVHEALIRHWPKLVDWIDRDRAFQSWLRQIRSNVELWSADPSDDGPLLRGGMLAQARDWLARRRDDLSPAEQGYIEASIALRRRAEEEREAARQEEIRRQQELAETAVKLANEQRWRAKIAFLGGIIALFLACFGGYEAINAHRSAEQALSRQLAAQSLADADASPQRSLLLAAESIGLARSTGIFHSLEAAKLLHTLLGSTGGVPLLGHVGAIKAVAFSPDGHMVATGDADGTVRLWNPAHPQALLHALNGHSGAITGVMFSRNGQWIVTASEDGTVRIWSAAHPLRSAPIVFSGHSGAIKALAISPDSRWLATAGADGTARLWDLKATDPPVAPVVLATSAGPFTAATFSPTGRWLAIASLGGNVVRLWDMKAPEPAHAMHRMTHRDQVGEDALNAIAFSPDERRLAIAFGYTVQLWDLTAADPPAKPLLEGRHPQWIQAIGFSPRNGHWLATAGLEGTIKLWDISAANPAAHPIVLNGHQGKINVLAFDPTDKWLASAGDDLTVRLWKPADPSSPPVVLRGHESAITTLAFSPDGHRLVTGSNDSQARLWNMPDASLDRIVMRGYGAPVDAVAFSPRSKWLAAISDDRTVRLWNTTQTHLQDIPIAIPFGAVTRSAGAGIGFAVASFSPDGHWLATSTEDNTVVWLWNLIAANPAAAPLKLGPAYSITALGFSPDGRWLVSTSWNGKVQLWNFAAGVPSSAPNFLCVEREPAQGLAFSADGREMATGSHGYTARLWRLTDPNPCAHPIVITAGPVVNDLAISQNGAWLATTSWEPEYRAKLWHLTDTAPPALSAVLQFNKDRAFSVAFSPDTHWMAAAAWDHTVQLLDVSNLTKAPISLLGHQGRVLGVAFSPDGRLLASLGEDHTIRLWDPIRPTAEPAVLNDGAGFSTKMVFNPDGRWLATGSGDGAVKLWWLHVDDLIRMACHTAGRNLTKGEWQAYLGGSSYRKTCPDLPDS